MAKIFKLSFLSAVLILMSACDSTKPMELFYYDREKIILDSETGSDKNIFLCVKGETEDETKKRANNANSYYSAQLTIIVKEFAESIMPQYHENEDGEESEFSYFDTAKAGLQLQKRSSELGTEVEKKFHCMFLDTIESD